MSGLSPATVGRLVQLEAQPELQDTERGEVRSMAHSRPTAEERARLDRLLAATPPAPTTPPPGVIPPPPGGAAYDRGLERAKTASGWAQTAPNER